jgi:hypothetical protein
LITNGESVAVVEARVSLWRAIREERVWTVTENVQRVVGRKPIAEAV